MARLLPVNLDSTLQTLDCVPVQKLTPSIFDRYFLKTNEKSLLELINLGLSRTTIAEVIQAIESGRPLDAVVPQSRESNAYLAKILREEVQKQFSEHKRPLVEMILNAVDARPKDYQGLYIVDVELSKSRFSVTDPGKGMSLQKIMDTLIIPFNSDKDSYVDIGRFGVGFFSILQYCLHNPKKTEISVLTSDGSAAYELGIRGLDDRVENLISSLRKTRVRGSGTTVGATGLKLDIRETMQYLRQYLDFLDPARAVIRVNGSAINLKRQMTPAYTEYSVPVTVRAKNKVVEQRVRVAIDVLAERPEGRNMNLYSQGVFNQSRNLRSGCVDIDFPSAVLPVEGRDELKQDSNYWACIDASLNALLQYGKDNRDNQWALMNLREMIPSFLEHFGKVERGIVTKALAVCFPRKAYLVTDTDGLGMSLSLREFLGEDTLEDLYLPKTNRAYSLWEPLLPGASSLVLTKSRLLGKFSGSKSEVERKVMQRLGKPLPHWEDIRWSGTLYLVEPKSKERTASPVLSIDGDTFVNVRHPLFRADGYVQHYAVKTAMLRQLVGEEAMEQRMVAHQ